MTEVNVQQAVPLFGVHDIQRSVRFYVDGLGFSVTKQWNDEGTLRWCRLQLGNAAVMLQEFWRGGQRRNVPAGELGLGVSVNFLCNDALALWRAFVARGLSADRPLVGNGRWVTHVSDPDGYHLYFESPTSVPEGTVFSDTF